MGHYFTKKIPKACVNWTLNENVYYSSVKMDVVLNSQTYKRIKTLEINKNWDKKYKNVILLKKIQNADDLEYL